MVFRRLLTSLGAIALLLSGQAFAQNTGGVFGPVVNDGHASLQYRIAYRDDNDGVNQRVHFQHAPTDNLMWRVVGQVRKTTDSDADFDFVQGELFVQLTPNDATVQHGLRFDARVRGDDRPGFLGANYSVQRQFNEGWRVRGAVLTSVEVGSNARDGVFLQTRGQFVKRLEGGQHIGVELYSSYGSTDDLRDFDEQSHQIGPILTVPLADNVGIFAGALFGLTDGSPDTDFRVWLTRSF